MKAQDIRTVTRQLFHYLTSNKERTLQIAADNAFNVQACIIKLTSNIDYWQQFARRYKIKQQFATIFKLPAETQDKQFKSICLEVKQKIEDQINEIEEQQNKLSTHKTTIEVEQQILNMPVSKKEQLKSKIAQIKAPQKLSLQQYVLGDADAEVIVKYDQKLINKDYEFAGYKLKMLTKKFVNKYLLNNKIQVFSKCKVINILNCEIYQKSKDAGNYIFDPFCNAIKFQLVFLKNQQFQNSLLTFSKDVAVSFEQKGQIKETQASMPHPREDIKKLLQILCEKKKQSHDELDKICQKFKQIGGVSKINDLFEWTKEDYQKVGVRITYIYELMEMVDISKEQNGQGQEGRSSNEEERECVKVANSHKILRYLMYEIHGKERLQKNISFLNYQNMKKAISIVRAKIINDQLLDELQKYFFQFTAEPKEGVKEDYSRGMVLFGPPGTGKTVLTQTLPSMIGFHLIEKGLSAADFMKSLVGQSSRMIKDLVNRAKVSPHLLCSIGIDEVDGLVPDRKDKEEKNKGEGISMLLSVIGGNKDVSNLVFMTSTNHMKKIDEAIRRRLSGQFQVGRPSPQARMKILKQVPYLKDKPDFMNHLILITSNFTGAALKRLNGSLVLNLRKKEMDRVAQQLFVNQINQIATVVARQFSITLGIYTLPEIYANHSNKRYLLSLNFLSRIANQLLIVSKKKNNSTFTLYYSTKMQKYQFDEKAKDNKFKTYFQIGQQTLNIEDQGHSDFKSLERWIRLNNTNKDLMIEMEEMGGLKLQQYYNCAKKKLEGGRQSPTLLLIEDIPKSGGSLLKNSNYCSKPKDNLYVLFYFSQHVQPKLMLENLNWEKNQQKNYSGRVFVELSDEPKMAFQLNSQKDESPLHFKYFLKSQKSQTPNDVIPELVDFFTTRNVSYILLLDYQLVLQNSAYDEQKTLQIIDEKMSEAINYSSVAVIINMDSLIILNQSASDSNMGRSKSYSVADHGLYRLLLQYIKEFPVVEIDVPHKSIHTEQSQMVNKKKKQISQTIKKKGNTSKKQKWVSIIAKNSELIKLLKNDLNWPDSPQQIKQKDRETKLNQRRRCASCGLPYSEKQNVQQMKCMQHPGHIINIHMKTLEVHMTVGEAKIQELKFKRKSDKSTNDSLYVYACCLKGVGEQGQTAYKHRQKNQPDECQKERNDRIDEWRDVCNRLGKI